MAKVHVPDWPTHMPSASRSKIKREDGTWRARVKQILSNAASSLGDSSHGDHELIGLARASTLLDELTREAVDRARSGDAPLSWAEIGAALGVSKQAAQQRYGRD